VRPSVITAEIGAKNGCECPTISVAISQATDAATEVWRMGRAVAMIRSRRVRRPAREASAACSMSSARGGIRSLARRAS
jgi:hypothetical protein